MLFMIQTNFGQSYPWTNYCGHPVGMVPFMIPALMANTACLIESGMDGPKSWYPPISTPLLTMPSKLSKKFFISCYLKSRIKCFQGLI